MSLHANLFHLLIHRFCFSKSGIAMQHWLLGQLLRWPLDRSKHESIHLVFLDIKSKHQKASLSWPELSLTSIKVLSLLSSKSPRNHLCLTSSKNPDELAQRRKGHDAMVILLTSDLAPLICVAVCELLTTKLILL